MIKADNQTRDSAGPLPDDLCHALIKIRADVRTNVSQAFVFLVGRLVGAKMGSGRPPTLIRLWAGEPVAKLDAGARPGRVTYCCLEHAGQNFGSLDRGPRAIHPM